jgi:hypothetical protein
MAFRPQALVPAFLSDSTYVNSADELVKHRGSIGKMLQ